MAIPESPRQAEVAQSVLQRISAVARAKYPPISDNANYVSKMIARKHFILNVTDPASEFVQPWIVDFRPRRSSLDGELEGTLVVDPIRFRSSKVGTVDAELVRAVSVAVQFPDRGYCRPLRDVYREAIEIQHQWLNAMQISATMHDPRVMPMSVIIQNILGKQGYYTDFGFGDWNSALDMLIDDQDRNNYYDKDARREVLNSFIMDRSAFLLARASSSLDQNDERRFIPELCAKLESLPQESLAMFNASYAINRAVASL